MVKLYVLNKPLFLVEKIEAEVEDYLHRQTTIFVDELNTSAVKTVLHELQQPEFYAGVLLHANVNESLKAFKEQFTVLVAAGGLVKTQKNELLLIFRKGKWDLPKGKLDEGEDLERCAIREIQEETGLESLEIVKPLHITYHTYYEGDHHILKESHWFLMKTETAAPLQPQIEEDIEKCEWVPTDKLSSYITNMHSSIIDVLEKELAVPRL